MRCASSLVNDSSFQTKLVNRCDQSLAGAPDRLPAGAAEPLLDDLRPHDGLARGLVAVAIAAAAGATEGWSEGVRAHVQETSAGSGAWAATTTGGATLNNGTGTTLTVKIPEDAPSGAWASIFLLAAHEDDHHHVLPGEDYAHLQMVGVYVP